MWQDDSPFTDDCQPDGHNPIQWEPKSFQYQWLELWFHEGTTKIGIANITKPVYWTKGLTPGPIQDKDLLTISGPTVIAAYITDNTEILRVLRKTPDSVIAPYITSCASNNS